MLGLSSKGNNLKLAIGNFIVMFIVTFIFALDDFFKTANPETFPSIWLIIKMALASAVITLIFYGYNKQSTKEKTT